VKGIYQLDNGSIVLVKNDTIIRSIHQLFTSFPTKNEILTLSARFYHYFSQKSDPNDPLKSQLKPSRSSFDLVSFLASCVGVPIHVLDLRHLETLCTLYDITRPDALHPTLLSSAISSSQPVQSKSTPYSQSMNPFSSVDNEQPAIFFTKASYLELTFFFILKFFFNTYLVQMRDDKSIYSMRSKVQKYYKHVAAQLQQSNSPFEHYLQQLKSLLHKHAALLNHFYEQEAENKNVNVIGNNGNLHDNIVHGTPKVGRGRGPRGPYKTQKGGSTTKMNSAMGHIDSIMMDSIDENGYDSDGDDFEIGKLKKKGGKKGNFKDFPDMTPQDLIIPSLHPQNSLINTQPNSVSKSTKKGRPGTTFLMSNSTVNFPQPNVSNYSLNPNTTLTNFHPNAHKMSSNEQSATNSPSTTNGNRKRPSTTTVVNDEPPVITVDGNTVTTITTVTTTTTITLDGEEEFIPSSGSQSHLLDGTQIIPDKPSRRSRGKSAKPTKTPVKAVEKTTQVAVSATPKRKDVGIVRRGEDCSEDSEYVTDDDNEANGGGDGDGDDDDDDYHERGRRVGKKKYNGPLGGSAKKKRTAAGRGDTQLVRLKGGDKQPIHDSDESGDDDDDNDDDNDNDDDDEDDDDDTRKDRKGQIGEGFILVDAGKTFRAMAEQKKKLSLLEKQQEKLLLLKMKQEKQFEQQRVLQNTYQQQQLQQFKFDRQTQINFEQLKNTFEGQIKNNLKQQKEQNKK
jgi:hypothetical protein